MYHEMQYRVPYADTDQMGVVYYANYLEYFERSRTEMFRDAGLSYAAMEEMGYYLPVAEANCKYKGSARYDDLLTFRSWVDEIGKVQVKLCTEVIRDGKVLVSGHVWLGCVDKNFRISRIPPEILKYCKMCTPRESEQL